MKRLLTTFTIVYLLITGFPLFAQQAQQDKDIVKESTSYFSLDSAGNFDGYGADFILQKVAESQFFLIGEQHDIQAIEMFVRSLVPYFKESGYRHYVTEIGPIAARKLAELKRDSLALKSYYAKYVAQTNLAPFGFFGTEGEEKTVEQLQEYGINLCGIDFENYASYLCLIDEIYKNADEGKVPERLYNRVYSIAVSAYQQGTNDFNPQLMMTLLQSAEVNEFLDLAANATNAPVIDQFRLSLEINHQQMLGFWQRRVDNMKDNFAAFYHAQLPKEDTVKAFVKLGSVHTARGTSFSGYQEVGNMIYELANVNRSGSFSLITFPRYVVDGETGEMQDVMEEEERDLVKYAFPDQWTVINLRQLEELSIRDHIRLDKNMLDYIRKYDAMVIPPAAEYAKEIRWKD